MDINLIIDNGLHTPTMTRLRVVHKNSHTVLELWRDNYTQALAVWRDMKTDPANPYLFMGINTVEVSR